MGEQIVELNIDGKTGQVEIHTEGFHGKTCEDVANQILVGLNGKTVEDRKTPEYYEDGNNPVEVFTGK